MQIDVKTKNSRCFFSILSPEKQAHVNIQFTASGLLSLVADLLSTSSLHRIHSRFHTAGGSPVGAHPTNPASVLNDFDLQQKSHRPPKQPSPGSTTCKSRSSADAHDKDTTMTSESLAHVCRRNCASTCRRASSSKSEIRMNEASKVCQPVGSEPCY